MPNTFPFTGEGSEQHEIVQRADGSFARVNAAALVDTANNPIGVSGNPLSVAQITASGYPLVQTISIDVALNRIAGLLEEIANEIQGLHLTLAQGLDVDPSDETLAS